MKFKSLVIACATAYSWLIVVLCQYVHVLASHFTTFLNCCHSNGVAQPRLQIKPMENVTNRRSLIAIPMQNIRKKLWHAKRVLSSVYDELWVPKVCVYVSIKSLSWALGIALFVTMNGCISSPRFRVLEVWLQQPACCPDQRRNLAMTWV